MHMRMRGHARTLARLAMTPERVHPLTQDRRGLLAAPKRANIAAAASLLAAWVHQAGVCVCVCVCVFVYACGRVPTRDTYTVVTLAQETPKSGGRLSVLTGDSEARGKVCVSMWF